MEMEMMYLLILALPLLLSSTTHSHAEELQNSPDDGDILRGRNLTIVKGGQRVKSKFSRKVTDDHQATCVKVNNNKLIFIDFNFQSPKFGELVIVTEVNVTDSNITMPFPDCKPQLRNGGLLHVYTCPERDLQTVNMSSTHKWKLCTVSIYLKEKTDVSTALPDPCLGNRNPCKNGTCKATENGTVVCECLPGYIGVNCDHTCHSGRFGISCASNCSEGCLDNKCNWSDGSCTCKPGWEGPSCVSKCSNGTYGINCLSTCSLGCADTCDKSTGACICYPGYRGDKCRERCKPGRYGVNCTGTCSDGCVNKTCNAGTGTCQCHSGWMGDLCDQGCKPGRYGVNCTGTCSDGCVKKTCNAGTGTCQCRSGWMGNLCDQECSYQYYGSKCVERCSYGCVNYTCSGMTGECDCQLGWRGPRCDHKCSRGTYGSNCSKICSIGCHGMCLIDSGRCRCKLEWTGERCEQKLAVRQTGSPSQPLILQIVGACALFIIIIVIGSAIIFLKDPIKRRRNGRNDKTSHPEAGKAQKEAEETVFKTGIQGPSQPSDQASHVDQAPPRPPKPSRTVPSPECSTSDSTDTSSGKHRPSRFGSRKSKLGEDTEVKQRSKKSRRNPDSADKQPASIQNSETSSSIFKKAKVTSEDGDPPNNTDVQISMSRVDVKKFPDYLSQKKATENAFQMDYKELPKGLCASHAMALIPKNNVKNRFKGIYPYDHTRVCLTGSRGDYINANYITGPSNKRQYIASQGPLPNTVRDFWEMVWQNQCPVIVMLTKLKENQKIQCEPYWLDKGEARFGEWKVTCADICQLADYTVRTLNVRGDNGIGMTVKHVHFIAWPDKSVPRFAMSLVDVRQKAREFCDFDKGPMLVHCSAGVGRTGTLIALDYLLQEAEEEGSIDIYACVWKLRTQRLKMVQTEEQYVFLHQCLLEALAYPTPPVTTADFLADYRKNEKRNSNDEILSAKFEILNASPTPMTAATVARYAENLHKNRNCSLVPDDRDRPILMTDVEGGTDYINAVIVPSFKKPRGYILTQTPLQSTVVDFWRLVHEYNIVGVVMLDVYTRDNSSDCGVYWPEQDHPSHIGPFAVSLLKTHKHPGFQEDIIKYTIWEKTREISVFREVPWNNTADIPKENDHILSLLDYIRQWNPSTAPILVHCRDGATRCGLFCVVDSVQEQVLTMQQVSVDKVIRTVRNFRKDAIATVEQYVFCHEVIAEYLEKT